MAERGRETLRHGPMKPVGLTNPHQPDEKPYAVVQLRQDNALGTLFNMVGFQTKLKHGEQTRIFRTIPGLEKAEFARLGGLHRNTYLNSPKLLDADAAAEGDAAPALRRADHRLRGLRGERRDRPDGRAASRRPSGSGGRSGPAAATTALGALINHITGGHIETIERRLALLPADERQFRPVSAAREHAEGRGRQAPARAGESHGQEEGAHRPGAGGFVGMAHRTSVEHRRGIANLNNRQA